VQVQDQPKAVASSVGEFVKVLIEAVVIVLAVSFISLGLHNAGEPLVEALDIDPARPGGGHHHSAGAGHHLLAMYYWGIGLHKMSLGSLIIALGLLVDDAIIAVEMMVRKLEEGYDKVRAATFAYELTAMPMLTGTLITAAGFLPIGIAKSAVGEYTFAIFAVTVIALVLSWIVSVYFVPYLGTLLLKAAAAPMWWQQSPAVASGQAAACGGCGHHRRPARGVRQPVLHAFRRLVNWCVRTPLDHHRRHVADFCPGHCGHGQGAAAVLPGFQPPRDPGGPVVPRGHLVCGQRGSGLRVEKRLMEQPGVATVSGWVGSGVPRFYLPLDQMFPQSNVSQFIVLAQDLKKREALRLAAGPAGAGVPRGAWPRQAAAQRAAGAVSGAVPRDGAGPAVLRAHADEVKAVLRASPHMRGVNDNWNESVKVLRLEVDQDKARALGVTSQSIAQASRTMLTGMQVGQYREGDKLIDIVLRQPRTSAAPSPTLPTPTCPRPAAARSRSRRSPSRCSPGSRA
jgi:multidrug efflux pump